MHSCEGAVTETGLSTNAPFTSWKHLNPAAVYKRTCGFKGDVGGWFSGRAGTIRSLGGSDLQMSFPPHPHPPTSSQCDQHRTWHQPLCLISAGGRGGLCVRHPGQQWRHIYSTLKSYISLISSVWHQGWMIHWDSLWHITSPSYWGRSPQLNSFGVFK